MLSLGSSPLMQRGRAEYGSEGVSPIPVSSQNNLAPSNPLFSPRHVRRVYDMNEPTHDTGSHAKTEISTHKAARWRPLHSSLQHALSAIHAKAKTWTRDKSPISKAIEKYRNIKTLSNTNDKTLLHTKIFSDCQTAYRMVISNIVCQGCQAIPLGINERRERLPRI
jgi:hypothetical protein